MMVGCHCPKTNSASSVRSRRSSNRTPRSRSGATACRADDPPCSSSVSSSGLAVTVACLAVNFVAAFVAFLFVVLMAVKLESEVRLLGREQLGQLPISAWLHARRPDEQSDIVD